jgi:hypothetical protein
MKHFNQIAYSFLFGATIGSLCTLAWLLNNIGLRR